MSFLSNIFHNPKALRLSLTKDDIAHLLGTSPEALKEFEDAYRVHVLNNPESPDNYFGINAKQAKESHTGVPDVTNVDLDDQIRRIVTNLYDGTAAWSFDGKEIKIKKSEAPSAPSVTKEELMAVPEEIRPQFTEQYLIRQMNDKSSDMLLFHYKKFTETTNMERKKMFYNLFRQGLDILDLDPILYEMLGMNPNSMGYWLPKIIGPVLEQDFFQIPKTTIIKVPISMLQLSRLDYEGLNRTTRDIVDQYCMKTFNLKTDQEYFVKTGTFSSKFDFCNAYIHDPQEIRELGEYLVFLSNQAVCMAGGLNGVCHYGVSTCNEWVVREFVPDQENNPCIYKGLPLHTEYRVFVDFDERKILGISPYWRSDIMKRRFGHEADADNPHNVHDYTIYTMHEPVLMKRYEENKDLIAKKVEELVLDQTDMTGQWSIDIMQNGSEFWLIDMALAVNSALADVVPSGLIRPIKENWIPQIEKKES